jgi:hypothetical protein
MPQQGNDHDTSCLPGVDGEPRREILNGPRKDKTFAMLTVRTGAIQDKVIGWGQFIDDRESARRGQGPGRVQPGKDSRVGMPYRPYEPLSVV